MCGRLDLFTPVAFSRDEILEALKDTRPLEDRRIGKACFSVRTGSRKAASCSGTFFYFIVCYSLFLFFFGGEGRRARPIPEPCGSAVTVAASAYSSPGGFFGAPVGRHSNIRPLSPPHLDWLCDRRRLGRSCYEAPTPGGCFSRCGYEPELPSRSGFGPGTSDPVPGDGMAGWGRRQEPRPFQLRGRAGATYQATTSYQAT